MTIKVTLDREAVPISREVFAALVEQSVIYDYVPIRRALTPGAVPCRELVRVARKAEILIRSSSHRSTWWRSSSA